MYRLHKHFRLGAKYNLWANERLYDVCAGLEAADYRRSAALPYFTIHGMLNHLLVVDRLWLARLRGYEPDVSALDEELHDDFKQLREARDAEDVVFFDYVYGLSDEEIERPFGYRDRTGGHHASTPREVLTHLWLHQTQHRGQVHAVLEDHGTPVPTLGYLTFVREVE